MNTPKPGQVNTCPGSFLRGGRIACGERGEGNGGQSKTNRQDHVHTGRSSLWRTVQSGGDADIGRCPGLVCGRGEDAAKKYWLRDHGIASGIVLRRSHGVLGKGSAAAGTGMHVVWGNLLCNAAGYDSSVLWRAVQRRWGNGIVGFLWQRFGNFDRLATGKGCKTPETEDASLLSCTKLGGR